MTETGPLFYVREMDEGAGEVRKRPERGPNGGLVLGFAVCECDDMAAATEIAQALNRLPEAEGLLLNVAGVLRSGNAEQLNAMAETIENWMVG